jgi:hypothetical protein
MTCHLVHVQNTLFEIKGKRHIVCLLFIFFFGQLWADRVSIFKLMNVKLQISKLSKIRSKQKMCNPCVNFKQSLMMMMSELIRWGFKRGQLNQPWLWYPLYKTTNCFVYSHFKPSQRVHIKGWPCFSQDQKIRNRSLASKFSKTTKIFTTKFVAKRLILGWMTFLHF